MKSSSSSRDPCKLVSATVEALVSCDHTQSSIVSQTTSTTAATTTTATTTTATTTATTATTTAATTTTGVYPKCAPFLCVCLS